MYENKYRNAYIIAMERRNKAEYRKAVFNGALGIIAIFIISFLIFLCVSQGIKHTEQRIKIMEQYGDKNDQILTEKNIGNSPSATKRKINQARFKIAP